MCCACVTERETQTEKPSRHTEGEEELPSSAILEMTCFLQQVWSQAEKTIVWFSIYICVYRISLSLCVNCMLTESSL